MLKNSDLLKSKGKGRATYYIAGLNNIDVSPLPVSEYLLLQNTLISQGEEFVLSNLNIALLIVSFVSVFQQRYLEIILYPPTTFQFDPVFCIALYFR